MAQNVIINGVTYQSVPEVNIPTVGGGTAQFIDTSDATLDSGNKMLSGNTAYADGTKYTGTIQPKASTDVTVSGPTVTVPAGYYSAPVSASVEDGEAIPPRNIGALGATISVTLGDDGDITLTKTVSITPVVSEGYITSGTARDTTVSLQANCHVLAAQTYTPGTSDQIINMQTWLSGNQTIKGDANLVPSNILMGKSIFGVNGSLTLPTISQDATTKILSIS